MATGPLLCLMLICALAAGPAAAQAAQTRTGTLQAVVVDFVGDRSATRYFLRSGSERTVVRPTELAAEPGERVTVTGELRDGRLVGAVEATGGGAQAQAVAPGPRKTAVILLSFPGESDEPWSPDKSRSEVFTAADSVSAFYEEESYGEISLTGKLRSDGDVFGWFGLDVSTASCSWEAWRNAANAAVADAEIDLSGYQHLIYEFPYQSSCSTVLGTASLGGNWAMINGDFLGFGLQTTAHELGHNLGLLHAGSWTCTSGGVRVQISDSCSTGEYGDPFDVMGNIGFRHNNGWNLAKLGILSAENVETVEASGTYSIESALDPTSEPTVLRIPRTRKLSGAVASWYYLEVREKGGVFESAADASTTGVSVRATRAGLSPETALLDANPATASFHDAPLPAGGLFDGGPVRIGTLSAGGGSATVSVELDEEAPAAPAGLTATPGFEQVQLQWEPSADDHGVHRYIVFRDGSEVGVSASNSFSDSPVSVGEHEYVVYAEDMLGNRSDASQPLAVTVEPDEEPPSAPTGLTATVVFEGVQLQWEASTDDFGVDRYLVFRNGHQIDSSSSTSFLDSLVPAGEHEYVVYARDETGNQSTASEPATATMAEASGPVCGSGSCTVVYRYSGSATTWTVPAGVDEGEFTVEGARGAGFGFNLGGRVVATLGSLVGGDDVNLSVGGKGEPYAGAEGGAGGFNGGGDGTLGGGGGGFSSVELKETLMLLAGGGGGRGAAGFDAGTEGQRGGGSGGQGGQIGTSGFQGMSIADALEASLGGGKGGLRGGAPGAGVGGAGGQLDGASACAGGAGAGGVGADGESFAGGGAAPDAGGGGGGGYVGGGQGGGGAVDACGSSAGSGGGGGGSSFAAPGLSATFTGNVRNGDGQVSIVYPNPVKAGKRSYATERDQELVVPAAAGVLAGAPVSGGVTLSASVATPPANGALMLEGDGSFIYTPDPGYLGVDSFVYRATDSSQNYATATATVKVAAPPQPQPPSTPREDDGDADPPEPPAAPQPPPVPAPARPAVAIETARVPVLGRLAKIRLACTGGAPGSACRGVLSLTIAIRGPKRKRAGALPIARTRYVLASGRTRTVAVRVMAAAPRRLRHARHRLLRARAIATVAGGRTARRAVVLRPPTPRVRRRASKPRPTFGNGSILERWSRARERACVVCPRARTGSRRTWSRGTSGNG